MAATELFSLSLFNDASLVSYYRAEDLNDAKGTNTLTDNGTIAFNAAKFNNGFDLGSANTTKYASRIDGLGIDQSGAWSVNFWIQLYSLPTASNIWRLIRWQSTTGSSYYLNADYQDNAGTPRFNFVVADTAFLYDVNLSTTSFDMITITCSAAGAVVVYLNNVSVVTGTRGTGLGGNVLNIGSNAGAANTFVKGIYDDVSFWKRVLTATEVDTLYNGPAVTQKGYKTLLGVGQN